ncbi:unnamed protein product [Diamesa tonsa]
MIDQELWIFGYGSLIWKNNDFKFELKEPGFIKNYERKFFQNSIDHRGTLENPGRVVTLVQSSDPNARVYGMGYKIPDNCKDQVLEHLDFREKNGYERCQVKFYPDSDESSVKDIVIYVAKKENPSFNHQSNLNDIAHQIFHATGPSGTNREYLYNLADAMRLIYPTKDDPHLFELETMLRRMEADTDSIKT